MVKRVKILAIFVMLLCLLLQGCTINVVEEGTAESTAEKIVTPAKKTELTAEDLYEAVLPSVVEIKGTMTGATSTGTGFFYDEKGTVITNYHVIEDCTKATVSLSDGTTYDVEQVLGYDKTRDLAILKTTCKTSTPLKIRENAVKTGETVYAIGSSLGFLSGSLSNGIISTAERDVDGQPFIQTTTPISQGNSGGPLIDKEGNVVGVITAYFTSGQNLNLAIPVAAIANVSTDNPTTLKKMFGSSYDYDDYDDYDNSSLVGKWEGTYYDYMSDVDEEYSFEITLTFYNDGSYKLRYDLDSYVDAMIYYLMDKCVVEGKEFYDLIESEGFSTIDEFKEYVREEFADSTMYEGEYACYGDKIIIDGDEIEYYTYNEYLIFKIDDNEIYITKV